MRPSKYYIKGNLTFGHILSGMEGITKNDIPIDKLTKQEVLATVMGILYILYIVVLCRMSIENMKNNIENTSSLLYNITYIISIVIISITINLAFECHKIRKKYKSIIWEIHYNNYVSPMFDYLKQYNFEDVLLKSTDKSKLITTICMDTYRNINTQLISDKMDDIIDSYKLQDCMAHCFCYLKKLSIDANKMIAETVLTCLEIAESNLQKSK